MMIKQFIATCGVAHDGQSYGIGDRILFVDGDKSIEKLTGYGAMALCDKVELDELKPFQIEFIATYIYGETDDEAFEWTNDGKPTVESVATLINVDSVTAKQRDAIHKVYAKMPQAFSTLNAKPISSELADLKAKVFDGVKGEPTKQEETEASKTTADKS